MPDTHDETAVWPQRDPQGAGGEDAPTEHAPPPGGPAAPAGPHAEGSETGRGASARGSRTTYVTPLEALRADEVLRTRKFFQIGMILLLATIVTVQFIGGDPVLRRAFQASAVLAFLAHAGFILYVRDETRYSQTRALVPAVVTIGAGTVAMHYFGLYSPAPMVFMLGIYFFSLGSSLGAAVFAFVLCSGAQTAGMLLVAFHLIADRGMVRFVGVTVSEQVLMVGLVQLVYTLTFLFARMSRRATITAVVGLEQALRQVGQREALLQEANADLERALRGGHGGRFTGQQVGPWVLGELIGRGAMGEAYRARHGTSGLAAAAKLLHPEVQSEPAQMRRFLREAEIMSQLDSPHVVKVHDVGDGTQGPPYIAMELLEGCDLAWLLRKRRRLPVRQVVELVEQVASALEQARASEIVHRDLKPQNLFCADAGGKKTWKVLDFGVSKLGAVAGTLTRGHVIGTPGYMAPEQARGADVDHRADVFSLAVIAYRALTGRPAFTGEDYPKILFDICFVQPARPGELLPSLPPDVDLVLALGLAKSAAHRPPRAVDLAEALALAVEGRLPGAWRSRAGVVLAVQPWGKRLA